MSCSNRSPAMMMFPSDTSSPARSQAPLHLWWRDVLSWTADRFSRINSGTVVPSKSPYRRRCTHFETRMRLKENFLYMQWRFWKWNYSFRVILLVVFLFLKITLDIKIVILVFQNVGKHSKEMKHLFNNIPFKDMLPTNPVHDRYSEKPLIITNFADKSHGMFFDP